MDKLKQKVNRNIDKFSDSGSHKRILLLTSRERQTRLRAEYVKKKKMDRFAALKKHKLLNQKLLHKIRVKRWRLRNFFKKGTGGASKSRRSKALRMKSFFKEMYCRRYKYKLRGKARGLRMALSPLRWFHFTTFPHEKFKKPGFLVKEFLIRGYFHNRTKRWSLRKKTKKVAKFISGLFNRIPTLDSWRYRRHLSELLYLIVFPRKNYLRTSLLINKKLLYITTGVTSKMLLFLRTNSPDNIMRLGSFPTNSVHLNNHYYNFVFSFLGNKNIIDSAIFEPTLNNKFQNDSFNVLGLYEKVLIYLNLIGLKNIKFPRSLIQQFIKLRNLKIDDKILTDTTISYLRQGLRSQSITCLKNKFISIQFLNKIFLFSKLLKRRLYNLRQVDFQHIYYNLNTFYSFDYIGKYTESLFTLKRIYYSSKFSRRRKKGSLKKSRHLLRFYGKKFKELFKNILLQKLYFTFVRAKVRLKPVRKAKRNRLKMAKLHKWPITRRIENRSRWEIDKINTKNQDIHIKQGQHSNISQSQNSGVNQMRQSKTNRPQNFNPKQWQNPKNRQWQNPKNRQWQNPKNKQWWSPKPKLRKKKIRRLGNNNKLGRPRVPTVVVRSTYSNTLVTLLDRNLRVRQSWSCGRIGFKKAKKSTYYASNQLGVKIGKLLREDKRWAKFFLILRGIGYGKKAVLKGLRQSLRLRTTLYGYIQDVSLPHNGCRSRKRKRR
uniref:Ribosomal protein S11 n=1 Tax=Eukaryota sp. BB2 TaxID=1949062 RepID=A0A1X8VEX4_9EUKA|nr:ribosomal protein S11 [Eukaryota sp. BB2]AQL10431.1 ribosomal protein S11 [Eukaryota sp. BB2]